MSNNQVPEEDKVTRYLYYPNEPKNIDSLICEWLFSDSGNYILARKT
ncbi:14347_t:CDS:2 [Dentiscutata heterogama]|uniref:14347_t:CDS:1 n=1 Tax=Dentiscutata heterogama TaxID=1316150 RepID=A0ACA9KC19_9GLOM|nr:14347_t:CDS:2 [Dentiscutata heterogama]